MLQLATLKEGGPIFSRLVWGVMTWGVWGRNYSPQEMLSLISYGVEQDITTYDHADIYGHYTTENTFGQALSLQPALRQKIQLISKCGIKLVTPNRAHHKIKSYDTSIEHIKWSVEQSLRNLRTDYLDLLLIHRPSPLMNPDHIAYAFSQLKKEGKVLHFGVSNFTPSQFSMLNSRFPLVTNQIEAHLLHRSPFLDGTLDQLIEKKMRPMAWSPLSSQKLFVDEPSEQVQSIRDAATEIMEKRNSVYSLDQIYLAWILMHPSGILPVLGTTRKERMDAAIHALKIELTQEEWFALWSAAEGQEVP